MDWPDFDMPAVCPICLSHHEATANMTSESMPTDGDVSMCVVCIGLSVYDFSVPGKLRFPTDEELAAFQTDERLMQAQWAMRQVHKLFGPPTGDYGPKG